MTDAVTKPEHPTSQTELCLLLRLCNAFRQIVPNFARLAASFNNKFRKNQPKQFGTLDEQESATATLLNVAQMGPPVLSLPKTEGWYKLDTDAYDKQFGCILL